MGETLCPPFLCLPSKEIGSIFGGKDHTTVIHACEKIEKMAKESPEIAEKIERIIARIKSR
jgi:chromosomal replication initiator protein